MSLRDIGEIVNRAKQEKERQEHKSLSVQAYELFSKGKKPLGVAIALNIGQIPAIQYYTEYLRLVQIDDITKIYLEFKCDVWYFVELCKAAKAANISIPQVIKLLKIADNYLPSVEHRYEVLQKQNNELESNLNTTAKEFQNLSNHISYMSNRRDELKSECENEIARLQDLRHQAANLATVVNHFKNDNNGEYTKIVKTVKEEVQKNLSNVKPLLDMAIFSVIQSMRTDPDKCSSLVYSNNPRLSLSSTSDNSNSSHNYMRSGRQQQPQYNYSIEDWKTELLDQAEEFYTFLFDRFVCEVINGRITEQQAAESPPALPLEEDDNKQQHEQK
jgi:archaellum component FlaC